MDVKFMIAVTEAEEAAKKKKYLVEKVRAAMEVTNHHWMLTDDDLRFKAAVAGTIMSCEKDCEREILSKEIKALNSLSALLSGVPVDLSQIEMPKTTVGLMQLWIEIKEGKK